MNNPQIMKGRPSLDPILLRPMTSSGDYHQNINKRYSESVVNYTRALNNDSNEEESLKRRNHDIIEASTKFSRSVSTPLVSFQQITKRESLTPSLNKSKRMSNSSLLPKFENNNNRSSSASSSSSGRKINNKLINNENWLNDNKETKFHLENAIPHDGRFKY